MKNVEKHKERNIQSISLLFFAVSFIGWVFETFVCLFQSGELCDRGFLTLPFCPVYGAPVCVVYFLFGTPSNGLFYRLLTKKKEKSTGQGREFYKLLSVVFYFLSATLIATGAELIVGLILDNAGVSLWSYNGVALCYKGVICLPVSLLWGTLISLFAQFLLPKIEKVIIATPKNVKTILTIVLWLAIGVDFILNWQFSLKNGTHFDVVDYLREWRRNK